MENSLKENSLKKNGNSQFGGGGVSQNRAGRQKERRRKWG